MDVMEWLGEDNWIGNDIYEKKYRHNNESFEEWLNRVSGGERGTDLKRLIREKKFLPAGRILSNRGLCDDGVKATLSNCYVLAPPEDSIEGIFDAAKELARTFSYGGGVGIDLGKLRPTGMKVNNAAKTTTGAVSFMELYNVVTGLIGQSGRRGALMLSMPVNHPDIEQFITSKLDTEKINNANISVRIDDSFMHAVDNNENYTLHFTCEESGEKIAKEVSARKIFKIICEASWKSAEPGVLFWDTINRRSLLQFDDEFMFTGVNPCGEEPLPPYGACLLGSMNLSEYVNEPFSVNAAFDFKNFSADVCDAVKALNDILDEGIPLHPLHEQRETAKEWRQIGLGIMGLSDLFVKMGIRYGSDESIELSDEIAKIMFQTAVIESIAITYNDGSYPAFKKECVNKSDLLKEACLRVRSLRNSQLLTIPPTGTISTMIGVSGGIEPIFANSYTRKTKSLHNKDVEYKVFTPIVKEYMELNGITDEADLPNYFVTAKDIPYKERIAVQAAWQKWIDASISSTINLPESATVEDIEDIYMTAWKSGLKGITIYRDGCDRAPILDDDKNRKNGDTHNDAPDAPGEYKRGFVKKSDDSSIGVHRRLVTGCGTLWLHIYFDRNSGDLIECFVSKGSAGGCGSSLVGLSRMVSLALRGGVSLDDVVDQLKSADVCESYKRNKEASKGRCCPSAIGYALVDANEEMKHIFAQKESKPDSIAGIKKEESDGEVNGCPHCGELLVHEGGCVQCISCGWSRCG